MRTYALEPKQISLMVGEEVSNPLLSTTHKEPQVIVGISKKWKSSITNRNGLTEVGGSLSRCPMPTESRSGTR